jgi:hypothetical protein
MNGIIGYTFKIVLKVYINVLLQASFSLSWKQRPDRLGIIRIHVMLLLTASFGLIFYFQKNNFIRNNSTPMQELFI